MSDFSITTQLTTYPANGTVLLDYATGASYVAAGGAALGIQAGSGFPLGDDIAVDEQVSSTTSRQSQRTATLR